LKGAVKRELHDVQEAHTCPRVLLNSDAVAVGPCSSDSFGSILIIRATLFDLLFDSENVCGVSQIVVYIYIYNYIYIVGLAHWSVSYN
jgi:hypothetical protein